MTKCEQFQNPIETLMYFFSTLLIITVSVKSDIITDKTCNQQQLIYLQCFNTKVTSVVNQNELNLLNECFHNSLRRQKKNETIFSHFESKRKEKEKTSCLHLLFFEQKFQEGRKYLRNVPECSDNRWMAVLFRLTATTMSFQLIALYSFRLIFLPTNHLE